MNRKLDKQVASHSVGGGKGAWDSWVGHSWVKTGRNLATTPAGFGPVSHASPVPISWLH